MSLNPNSSENSFVSEPSTKISLNIKPFNRCPAPKSIPTQPKMNTNFDSFTTNISPNMIRPM